MKEKLNEELISAITHQLSEEDNIVAFLSEILTMGKPSVYRRLRGEVLFTFEEVFLITQKLNISMDNIIGIRNVKRAIYDLSLPQTDYLYDKYYEILESYVQIFQKMGEDPASKVRLACNTLPYAFFLRHKNLSKFRLFRWINQNTRQQQLVPFSKVEVPQSIWEMQDQYARGIENARSTHLILDCNTFSSFVQDVTYFARLKLLTKEETEQLKQELFSLLEDLETKAIHGCHSNGNEVFIYLSQVDIKTSYAYFECKNSMVCDLWVYAMNGISSLNSQICEIQKEWIESLRRYSMLISRSGEMQRTEYLECQRDCVRTL